jgi:hypothetical protein
VLRGLGGCHRSSIKFTVSVIILPCGGRNRVGDSALPSSTPTLSLNPRGTPGKIATFPRVSDRPRPSCLSLTSAMAICARPGFIRGRTTANLRYSGTECGYYRQSRSLSRRHTPSTSRPEFMIADTPADAKCVNLPAPDLHRHSCPAPCAVSIALSRCCVHRALSCDPSDTSRLLGPVIGRRRPSPCTG